MVAELIVHRKSHFLKIQAKKRPPGEVQDCKTRLKLTSCFDTLLFMHIIFYETSSVMFFQSQRRPKDFFSRSNFSKENAKLA